MKKIPKKLIIFLCMTLFGVMSLLPMHSSAQANPDSGTVTYTFLAPLSDQTTFDAAQDNALSIYLNMIIKILIGIAAVLAMIMIVAGGIQYMTSGLVSSKEAGKHRITNAIIGLLLALAAYLILFTINPDLLKTIDTGNNSTQFTQTTATQTVCPAGTVASNTGQCTTLVQGVCPSGQLYNTVTKACQAVAPATTGNGTSHCTVGPAFGGFDQAQCAANGGQWVPS
ncbi:MAG: hypothetical protein WDN09_00775 [bacterium]